MSTTDQLAPNATARLKMTAGSACSIAEFAMFLDQYEYVQDQGDPHRWVLDNPENRKAAEPCAIVLSDLNSAAEMVDVFGEGSEHFTNLNYLMQRGGWKSCSVVCRSADISAKMLARFVSVEVSSDFTLPASSLDANQQEQLSAAPTAPVTVVHQATAPASRESRAQGLDDTASDAGDSAALVELEAANHRVRELTIQLNGAQEMLATAQSDNALLQERVESLQAQAQLLATAQRDNALLQERIESLEAQAEQAAIERTAARAAVPAPASSVESVDSQLLMRIIDEYLLPTIDISSASSSKPLADLRAAGFDVQLRLVRAA